MTRSGSRGGTTAWLGIVAAALAAAPGCFCFGGGRTEECWNFYDDDDDGLADCFDGDCSASVYCFCAVDDTCDCPGVIPAVGPDAAMPGPPPDASIPTDPPPCIELACRDTDDNDRDGVDDCDDSDCYPSCGIESGNWVNLADGGVPTEVNLYAVWGSRPNDQWAVGEGGVILHWDGLAWTNQPSPVTVDLRDVFGGQDNLGNTVLYAVGFDGTILRYDGATLAWTVEVATDPLTMNAPVTMNLHGVWCDGSGIEAYASGDGGTVVHRDAAGVWLQEDTMILDRMFAIWSDGATVWAAGSFAVIISKPVGGAWVEVVLGGFGISYTGAFHGIWGNGGQTLFVGVSGQVVRADNGGVYTALMNAPETQLLDVWGVGGEVFMAGLDGYLVHMDPTQTFFYYVWGDPAGRPKYRFDGVWGYDPYQYVDSGPGDSGFDAGLPYEMTVVGATGTIVTGP